MLLSLTLCACAQSGAISTLPSQAASFASGGSYRALYSFGEGGKANDGRTPSGELIAVHGELYGSTQNGGTTNNNCSEGCGTIFEVSAAGKERVVYRFTGGDEGSAPLGSLLALNGVLYGTTSRGGAGGSCSGRCGTVFSVKADGTSYTVLYSFKGGSDGNEPLAGLVEFDGSLYGTTEFGGTKTSGCSSGCGTVFEVSLSGQESVIYRFKGGTDGELPVSRLIGFDGSLFGTTQYGGTNTAFCGKGCGTLFSLSPSGTKKTLHAFKYSLHSRDGAYPADAPTVSNGTLYGTTMGGGSQAQGTVFDANPSTGAEHVLHSFSCCSSSSDGAYPMAGLVTVKGTLYGTTSEGGSSNDGAIFSVTPSGSESVLHSFTGKPSGTLPIAGLFFMSRLLYGTTPSGGSQSEGMVFSIMP
jgi:uncharacterized repeat protein (TIGR03803 family)